MAEQNLASVAISITSLDRDLSRRLEPRAAAPQRRLETIRRLSEAGIPVMAFIAPLIPVLNDSELESLMQAAMKPVQKAPVMFFCDCRWSWRGCSVTGWSSMSRSRPNM